jgi:sulfate transport system ATP-binding protein
MKIQVACVSKRFGEFTALEDVSLQAESGELLALLGPSGSGKTTLLRVIAGLEAADSGRVHYGGEDVTERTARDRQVGFVFQHYALFRHMTVFENIAFGMRVRHRPRLEINERVRELLALVRLESVERRYPSQLSGGQRQRVALARALAIEPRVLLLDEPFGALDAKVRQELRQWIRRLHDEIHMTSVFVTHDQEEAFEVADRVVVMRRGRIEQVGAPAEVFENPANPFVMDFLGNVNVFQGRVDNGKARWHDFDFQIADTGANQNDPVTVYIRPHELEVARVNNGQPALPARVERLNRTGSVAKLFLSAVEPSIGLHVELSAARLAELGLERGDMVYVSPRTAKVFGPEPEYVI